MIAVQSPATPPTVARSPTRGPCGIGHPSIRGSVADLLRKYLGALGRRFEPCAAAAVARRCSPARVDCRRGRAGAILPLSRLSVFIRMLVAPILAVREISACAYSRLLKQPRSATTSITVPTMSPDPPFWQGSIRRCLTAGEPTEEHNAPLLAAFAFLSHPDIANGATQTASGTIEACSGSA